MNFQTEQCHRIGCAEGLKKGLQQLGSRGTIPKVRQKVILTNQSISTKDQGITWNGDPAFDIW